MLDIVAFINQINRLVFVMYLATISAVELILYFRKPKATRESTVFVPILRSFLYSTTATILTLLCTFLITVFSYLLNYLSASLKIGLG